MHVRLQSSMKRLFTTDVKDVVPTRLFALKHGASLVWGPETVDKAILHTKRVVDCEFAIAYF